MDIGILGDRFIGMFKEETENGFVLRLEVDFKSKIKGLTWTVFDKKNEDGGDNFIFTTPKNEKNHNEIYHVLGMEGIITFDDLIKHSKEVIDFNLEIEEKKVLLKEKMEELAELFAKCTIDELRELHFVFKTKIFLPDIPNDQVKGKRTKRKKENPTTVKVEKIVSKKDEIGILNE